MSSTAEAEAPVAAPAEMADTTVPTADDESREALLRALKREVKQIMEESVTRRFIHEESNYVTSLCATVESCLVHGLKRRVLGLFGTSSTFALIHKISKLCPTASTVLKTVLQTQQQQLKDKRLSSRSLDRFRNSTVSVKDLPVSARYLWIRVALFEKVLAQIVDFIARNATRYYEKEALMMDSVRGSMMASLLVGPCALEYTKMKTIDNYWADPSADELVQRHRIHSGRSLGSCSPRSPRRPPLQTQRVGSLSAGPADDYSTIGKWSSTGRDYVISLHQNLGSTLLYGKNNVMLCPAGQDNPLKGYLSLHQNTNGTLSIKWTPNELMHSNSPDSRSSSPNRSILWNSVLNLNVEDIIYLHYHQQGQSGGSIVFVGADGVQHPPVHFPTGQHPLSFLSCLENGLLPWGQLDPPLWLQKGKGKILPRLRRKTSMPNGPGLDMSSSVSSASESLDSEVGPLSPDSSQDFVFRIIPVMQREKLFESKAPRTVPANSSSSRVVALSSFSSLLKERFMSLSSSPASSPPSTPKSKGSSLGDESSVSAPVSRENSQNDAEKQKAEKRLSEPLTIDTELSPQSIASRDSERPSFEGIQAACDSMRSQILSRAFYGWLAHCRHLKTIRTHLSCLVKRKQVIFTPDEGGISPEVWEQLRAAKNEKSELEMHRLVYIGGVSPELRASVWPYLLRVLDWEEELSDKLEQVALLYEGAFTEWMAVEAIVRQCDKEAFFAARDREWRESRTEIPLVGEASMSLDVFEDSSSLRVEIDQTDEASEPVVKLDQNDTQTPNEPPVIKRLENLRADTADSSGRSTPEGGTYSKELIDTFALNLHRIEKDVHRCDRNHPYFTVENLEKLKNVMCTYVWQHLDTGYVQGMCDLAAPLLVTFDDEVLTYGCFSRLMDRMGPNFPHGGGMDRCLANMRSLIQVLDPELFELMLHNGDYTHFYFCYRWFLLDFKRELVYADVYRVWETIWAACHVTSENFVLFLALALLIIYREIILDNNMDFTDIIKFFNEMAERHDVSTLLSIAKDQIVRLQTLIDSV